MMLNEYNKFLRTYVLTIQGANGKDIIIGNFDGSQPLLSLDFSISQQSLATQSYSTFRIKNLDEATRKNIYRDEYIFNSFPKKIQLQAGYVGQPLSMVFSGVYIQAYSFREEGSVDYTTVIEANDMSLVLAISSFTSYTLSNPSGVTQNQLISYLSNKLQSKAGELKLTLAEGVISPNYSVPFAPKSVTLDGWTWDLLQTITDKTCFIDRNRLHCLLNNEAYSTTFTEISNSTGLVGTPRIMNTSVIAEMVFEPSISVGQSVELKTSATVGQSNLDSKYNGPYKVISVSHRGNISSSEGGKVRTIVTLKQNVNQRNAPLNGNVPQPNYTYTL